MSEFLSFLDTATPIVNATGGVTVTIDGYPIDVVTSESHDHGAEVTEYPREQGTDAIDHVRLKPDHITMDCIVSDTPLGPLAEHSSRQGDDVPSRTTYNRMLALRASGEPVTVVTSLAVFKDMVVSNLTVPRAAGEPHQLHFQVEFVHADFVVNQRRRVAVPGAGKKKGLGTVRTKQVQAATMVFTIAKDNSYGSIDAALASSGLRDGGSPLTSNVRLVLTEKNGTRHYEADPPNTPPADGYVDTRGYHPFAGSLLSDIPVIGGLTFDPATATWRDERRYVTQAPDMVNTFTSGQGGGTRTGSPQLTEWDYYNQGVLNYYNKGNQVNNVETPATGADGGQE